MLVEFRILCRDAEDSCSFVQKLTPAKEGYTIRRASKYDDFDHIVSKNFNTLQEAKDKMKSLKQESHGKILEHQIAVL